MPSPLGPAPLPSTREIQGRHLPRSGAGRRFFTKSAFLKNQLEKPIEALTSSSKKTSLNLYVQMHMAGFTPLSCRHFPGEPEAMAVTFAPCPQQGQVDVPAGTSVIFQRCPALCKQQLPWPMPSTQLSPAKSLSPFEHLVYKGLAFTGSAFLKVACVEICQ